MASPEGLAYKNTAVLDTIVIPSSKFRIRDWRRLTILLTAAALCCLSASIASADALVVTKAMTASTVVEISMLAAFFAIAGGSFVITSSSRVDEPRAEEIVTSLLHNVYRAFDFREEETIYDTLVHSVTGDLLTETYFETRRGLELIEEKRL